MINRETAAAIAYLAIADLVGREYFRQHFEDTCHSYPTEEDDEIEFQYFMAFDGDEITNKWTAFARVSVNRITEEVTLLDYKLPNGERMTGPIKPISFA